MSVGVWLHDMEQTFTMCHIEEHLQVTLASRCLYGDARVWWVTLGEPQLPSRTWAHFHAAVMSRYGPLPARGAGEPIRDPAIYRDMRHTRYQRLSQDWHAYPGEAMSHYCWRFQEMMLPYVPQDMPESELQALLLLRNGVPAHIRQFVPTPTSQMTIGSFSDDILEAETIAQTAPAAEHVDEAQAPDDDDGQEDPQYEVGPEDPIPEMPGPDAGDPMDAEDDSDDDVVPIDPPEHEDPPVIDIPSDDEDDMDGEAAYEEWDDPEEIADGDAPGQVVVLSDSDTSVSTLDDTD